MVIRLMVRPEVAEMIKQRAAETTVKFVLCAGCPHLAGSHRRSRKTGLTRCVAKGCNCQDLQMVARDGAM